MAEGVGYGGLTALEQWCLKACAPEDPQPLWLRQNLRPNKVPPRKPSSLGSLGSVIRKNDWKPVDCSSNSSESEVLRRVSFTVSNTVPSIGVRLGIDEVCDDPTCRFGFCLHWAELMTSTVERILRYNAI